jgi:NADPH-dependent 2,4-dienoyl-CoA reductase/sulfur reductase-like enzyme
MWMRVLGRSRELAVDCVVTLPLVVGPGLASVTTTQPDGFIRVDEYGRVEGFDDVYAAGEDRRPLSRALPLRTQ